MYLRLTPSWCCVLYAAHATARAGSHASSQLKGPFTVEYPLIAPLSDVSSLRPAMGQAIFAPIIRGMDAFINSYANIPLRRETPVAAPELQRMVQDIRTTAAGVDVVFWNIMWLQDDLRVFELPTPSHALRDSISRILPSIENAIANLSLYCVLGSSPPGGTLDRLRSIYETLFARNSRLDLIPCRQRLKIAVLEGALEELAEMLEDDDAVLHGHLVELYMATGEGVKRGGEGRTCVGKRMEVEHGVEHAQRRGEERPERSDCGSGHSQMAANDDDAENIEKTKMEELLNLKARATGPATCFQLLDLGDIWLFL
ncbi:hypothetical protein HDZ31DRAFT_76910 [Schizophyllum fasciatum]